MGKGSSAAEGALGGAASGAAAGSVAGPWGAVIGGAAGGVIGGIGGWLSGGNDEKKKKELERKYGLQGQNQFQLPGYQNTVDQYGQLAGRLGGRVAPQSASSGYVPQQQALGRQLAAEAQGRGLGQQLIRNQAQAQSDQGYRQQLSAAASARPGQGAMAARQAMMNTGNANAMMGGQVANAAGQYQLGAMNNYGQFLQSARAQDEAQNQFNVDARLRQMGLNDAAQLGALGQRLQAQQAQQQGNQSYQNARYNYWATEKNKTPGPSFGQQLAGAGAGLANAYMQYKAGQK